MNLYLTDGTVLPVDNGPFTIEPDGAVLFMSAGEPTVIGAGWPDVLVDADDMVCHEFA